MMTTTVSVSTVYHCSLERAFRTPMLCDLSKVHTGFLVMPRVTHTTDDADWGRPGSSKKVYVAASLTQKGGFASVDRVIERIENRYWKIRVDDFQAWMLGFHRFVGEWKTTEIAKDTIRVDYTYTLLSNIALLYTLQWLFAKTFWKTYMRRVLENVRTMAYNNEPYLFA
jgi:hypothetical protein